VSWLSTICAATCNTWIRSPIWSSPTTSRAETCPALVRRPPWTRLFGGRSREEFPVVEEDGTLLGVISRRHLMDAYNAELMKRDMTAGLGGSLTATAMDEVQLGEGFKMAEIEAPGEFLDHTLGELDVRNNYGVQVVLIRRPTHSAAKQVVEMLPGPRTTISRGDRLVVMGSDDELRRLRAL
jgi:TrkA-C domain